MLKTIYSHKTIRKYKSDPVPEVVLNDILSAGTRASTTGNMQVYSIIVTQSPELKNKLLAAHFNQKMVVQAPVLLSFCADFNRFNKWCINRGTEPGYDNFLSFFTAAIDALLASQNCALAAEAHGLGICYLGTTTYNAGLISEILELPQHVIPVTTVVVGYPDENPGLTDRLPLEAVVHYEKYKDYSNEDIDDLYREKENLDFTKKLISENQLESLAHIFTEKRYTKKDNVLFSQNLLAVLEEKGFMNNK